MSTMNHTNQMMAACNSDIGLNADLLLNNIYTESEFLINE